MLDDMDRAQAGRDVLDVLVSGRRFSEQEARLDLALAWDPLPDAHYARRWKWTPGQVRLLRIGR